jgi:prepilin-type N-terminal cleavage/methylation domain-containing protein
MCTDLVILIRKRTLLYAYALRRYVFARLAEKWTVILNMHQEPLTFADSFFYRVKHDTKIITSNKGFSLVELSIVLVILGLLVGGVLTGKSLIRAAELRSITTDHDRFVAAVQIFNEKYQAFPGDMTNATTFWGAAAACPGTHLQPSTDATTCNGDGNGRVFGGTATSNESYRFWQHLANAGLISGTYSGVTGGGANDFTSVEANSPTGKISNQLWFVWHWVNPMVSGGTWFDGEYGNRLSTGRMAADGEPGGGLLTGEELWGIDKKIDDGKPAKGAAMTESSCTNATSTSDFESDYLLSDNATRCLIMFPRAF